MPTYLVHINVTAMATEEVEVTDEEIAELESDIEENPEILYIKAEKQLQDKIFDKNDFSALHDIDMESDDYDEIED